MTTEIATYQPAGAVGSFASSEGQRRMIALADEFRAICVEREKSGRKWLIPIGPSRHAIIEAWQYLGQRAGICARTAETRDVRHPVTGEFEGVLAVAEAQRMDTGETIGRAEQVCYADEVLQRKDGSVYRRWDGPDGRPQRHAILGMAQTRAQSRVLASVLRFLAEMAGIEGTPAEEMDGVRPEAPAPVPQPARKSAPPPSPPPLTPSTPPTPPMATGNVVAGTIEEVSEKSGKGGRGPWTLTSARLGKEWYGTFDTTVAANLRAAHEMGELVEIAFEIKVVNNRNQNSILTLAPVREPGAEG